MKTAARPQFWAGRSCNWKRQPAPPGPVVLHEVYTYELCYQNIGGADALNTMLVDELPVSVDYVDGTATDGGVYRRR